MIVILYIVIISSSLKMFGLSSKKKDATVAAVNIESIKPEIKKAGYNVPKKCIVTGSLRINLL